MAAKRGITTLTLHGQFHKITQFSEDTGTLHPFSPQVITKAYCFLFLTGTQPVLKEDNYTPALP